ncbi:family 43 glycosylhydrolase [Paenibacillus medicaginis]|uniref:Family 43 glycosylhydrolase n=1 Tax=Paenibacillus medicaginis TaxID=1470560 RepID=A0ABV5C2C8_9BACL
MRKQKSKWTGGLLLMLLLSWGLAGHAGAASVQQDFYNVVIQDGADPWAYKHTDGYYYFTKTTGNNVTIWKSRTLSGLDAGESVSIETGGQNIWAPEIHYLNGAWYIYYAKDDGDNANHRMYVLENTSQNPLQGTWQDRGQVTDNTNKWAIDGTVLQVGNQLYFIWSGWEGNVNVSQKLYIARMSNPWTIVSDRVEISTPEYTWETNHNPHVNEGPQVVIRGNIINLIYSASGSWTNDYCLGLITADINADLLQSSSWHKRSEPIFKSANGIYGPGHASFTTSPDGTGDWIVYHNAKNNQSGWNREIRIQPFTWNADNTPNLGSPLAPNSKIPVPSGEPERIRIEGEEGQFGGVAYASGSPNGSGGMKAGHIDTADSFVEYSIDIASAGEYILSARTANGTTDLAWSTLMISVNGSDPAPFYITNKGWENWGLSTKRVHLQAGENVVRFTKGNGYGEIDLIDVFPAD